jgi:hypothetical protein
MRKLLSIWSLTLQRAREGQVGLFQQIVEMLWLRIWRGVGPGYYHMGGFWRREIPWSLKAGQLSASEYRSVLLRLNPPEYRKISQHKHVEKALLSMCRVPTPTYLGLISRCRGVDLDGNHLRNETDLSSLACRHRSARLVFKRLEGHGGLGVVIPFIKLNPAVEYYRLDRGDIALSPAQFCSEVLDLDQGVEWLVEMYFEQHPVMANLNESSVNTVRIWVLRSPAGEVTVPTAYVRMGRKGMSVDNATSGGIVAPIDMATGGLRSAQDASPSRRQYPIHPDHGAQISGVIVPHWEDVQSIAKRALCVFPNIRFAGCDVAIGMGGPVMIELNVCPDREGAAFTDYRSRDLLRESMKH